MPFTNAVTLARRIASLPDSSRSYAVRALSRRHRQVPPTSRLRVAFCAACATDPLQPLHVKLLVADNLPHSTDSDWQLGRLDLVDSEARWGRRVSHAV